MTCPRLFVRTSNRRVAGRPALPQTERYRRKERDHVHITPYYNIPLPMAYCWGFRGCLASHMQPLSFPLFVLRTPHQYGGPCLVASPADARTSCGVHPLPASFSSYSLMPFATAAAKVLLVSHLLSSAMIPFAIFTWGSAFLGLANFLLSRL